MVSALRTKALKASFDLWYLHLGHVPFSIISMLNKLRYLSVIYILPSPGVCSSWKLAKSKRLSFVINEKRASGVLNLVHCDLWGSAPISTADAFRYYVAFKEDYSRFTWIFTLRAKSEFYDTFVRFHSFVCNQFSKSMKFFQSDGGTEFTCSQVQNFLN